MDETMNTARENTISSEPETNKEISETKEKSVTPQIEDDVKEVDAQTVSQDKSARLESESAPFLTVKYNHEEKGLSQEEAVSWAQKGMHYDALYAKLDYLAALKETTCEKLINSLISEHETSYKNSLIERLGGEDDEVIEDMMTLYRNRFGEKHRRAREFSEKDRLKENGAGDRLSVEFEDLRREFPELKSITDIPNGVVTAAENGTPLIDAYLRYRHEQQKRVTAAKMYQRAAAEKSVGSMNTDKKSKETETASRYLNALWRR